MFLFNFFGDNFIPISMRFELQMWWRNVFRQAEVMSIAMMRLNTDNVCAQVYRIPNHCAFLLVRSTTNIISICFLSMLNAGMHANYHEVHSHPSTKQMKGWNKSASSIRWIGVAIKCKREHLLNMQNSIRCRCRRRRCRHCLHRSQ